MTQDMLLSVKEAAQYLTVSVKTIRRMIEADELPAYRIGQKKIVIRRRDLDASIVPINTPRQAGIGVIHV